MIKKTYYLQTKLEKPEKIVECFLTVYDSGDPTITIDKKSNLRVYGLSKNGSLLSVIPEAIRLSNSDMLFAHESQKANSAYIIYIEKGERKSTGKIIYSKLYQ